MAAGNDVKEVPGAITALQPIEGEEKGNRTNYWTRYLQIQAVLQDAELEANQHREMEEEALQAGYKEAREEVQQACFQVLGTEAATELRLLREKRDAPTNASSSSFPSNEGIDYEAAAKKLLAHEKFLQQVRVTGDLERFGLVALQNAEEHKKRGKLQDAFDVLWKELGRLQEVQRKVGQTDSNLIFLLERQRRLYHELISICIDMDEMELAHAILCLAKGKVLNLQLCAKTSAGPSALYDLVRFDGSSFVAADFANLISAVKREIRQVDCMVVDFCMLPSGVATWLFGPDGTMLRSMRISDNEGCHDDHQGMSVSQLLELYRMGTDSTARARVCEERTCQWTSPQEVVAMEHVVFLSDGQWNEMFNEQGRSAASELRADTKRSIAFHRKVKDWEEVRAWLARIGDEREFAGMKEGISKLRHQVRSVLGVLALDHDQLRSVGISSAADQRRLLRRARRRYGHSAILQSLHTLLICPLQDAIRGAQELLVLPHRELWGVPWAALQDKRGVFLMQRHAIRLAPSLLQGQPSGAASGIAQARFSPSMQPPSGSARASSDSRSGRRLVVVGNPMPNAVGPLRGAEAEAKQVHAALSRAGGFRDCQMLLTGAASKANVLNAASGADWLHLACHCTLDGNGGELVLASRAGDDGRLSASEVAESLQLGLGCTVVLSACETARGDIREEGVVGLARAFLSVGAGAVLVTLWPVSDASTAAFMQRLYSTLLGGCSLARAVQAAMLQSAGCCPSHHCCPQEKTIKAVSATADDPTQGGTLAADDPAQGGTLTADDPAQGGTLTADDPAQGGTLAADDPAQGGTLTADDPAQGGTSCEDCHLSLTLSDAQSGEELCQEVEESLRGAKSVAVVAAAPPPTPRQWGAFLVVGKQPAFLFPSAPDEGEGRRF